MQEELGGEIGGHSEEARLYNGAAYASNCSENFGAEGI